MRRRKPGRVLWWMFVLSWAICALLFWQASMQPHHRASNVDLEGIAVIFFFAGDWLFTVWLAVKVWNWLFRSAGRAMEEGRQDAASR
jgi:hypothetical protein